MTTTTDRKESEIGMIPKEWEVLKLWEIAEIIMGQSPEGKHYNNEGDWIPFMQGNRTFWSKYNKIDTRTRKTTKVWKKWSVLMSVRAPVWDINISVSDLCIGRWLCSIECKNWENEFLYYLLQANKSVIIWNESWTVFWSVNKNQLEKIVFPIPPLSEQQAIAITLWSLDEKIELLREQNKTLEAMGQAMFKSWFMDFDGVTEFEDSELGQIPKGWKIYKLEELIESINGYSYKWSELVEASEEALVTLKSFDRNWGFQTRWFKPFVGKPKNTQEVFIGDLVVAHTDLTQNAEVLWNPAFIFDNGWYKKLYITMDLVKVISKHDMVKNSFLYYLMKTEEFKWHCIWYSSGTTVLHLSKKAIPEFEIALPRELDLVKKFSDSASDITTKITNNMYEMESLIQTRDSLLPRLMSGKVRAI